MRSHFPEELGAFFRNLRDSRRLKNDHGTTLFESEAGRWRQWQHRLFGDIQDAGLIVRPLIGSQFLGLNPLISARSRDLEALKPSKSRRSMISIVFRRMSICGETSRKMLVVQKYPRIFLQQLAAGEGNSERYPDRDRNKNILWTNVRSC